MIDYRNQEDSIVIKSMIDCPSVEMELDVGDNMYEDVVKFAKRNMTDADYFKVGFTLMLARLSDKKDHNGQLNFDFDEDIKNET